MSEVFLHRKGRLYTSRVRIAMLYGNETSQEACVSWKEHKWMGNATERDGPTNEELRIRLGTESICEEKQAYCIGLVLWREIMRMIG